ncbi:MAG TPA: hypothetical protein VLV48_01510 [Thermoanaerobaculia bacterium]|nr:hypothetical protein [Thermoanaerobaculia bacterium]
MAKAKAETKRVLLVKDNDGEFKVEIPEDAKLTFGPAVPYARKPGYNPETPQGYALRLYRGTKENLIAVFNGVHWFRDVTLPVSRLVIREAGKSVWKSDESGYEVQSSVKRDAQWTPDVKRLNAKPEDDLF